MTPPNVTLVVPERFVPLMITVVPPLAGPLEGEADVSVGADPLGVTNVKALL